MSVVAGMMPDWKHWKGDIVDGEFPLEQFLGSGIRGAVFRTRLPSGDGAIKLVPAGEAQAAHLVKQWNRARALEHPHLIRIVRTGTWYRDGAPVAYLVTECAGENLATVLRQRALTGDETLEMLEPVAQALAFLHGHGFAHGRLKPSNILAVNDTLKISVAAVAPGDASADLRDLTATMVQALTQQPAKFAEDDSQASVIGNLPPPFRDIARNCTGRNGRIQWSAAELAAWLQSQTGAASETAPAAARIPRSKTRKLTVTHCAIALALASVGAIAIGGVMRHRIADPVSAAPALTKTPETTPSAAPPTPAAHVSPPKAKTAKPHASSREPRTRRVSGQPAQVVREVLPDIPAKARRTVNGKATVAVRVAVNQSGDVTDAAPQAGGSAYFRKLAVEAARKWRFAAGIGPASREWLLRFEIRRTDTKVAVEKFAAR